MLTLEVGLVTALGIGAVISGAAEKREAGKLEVVKLEVVRRMTEKTEVVTLGAGIKSTGRRETGI